MCGRLVAGTSGEGGLVWWQGSGGSGGRAWEGVVAGLGREQLQGTESRGSDGCGEGIREGEELCVAVPQNSSQTYISVVIYF